MALMLCNAGWPVLHPSCCVPASLHLHAETEVQAAVSEAERQLRRFIDEHS